MKRREFPKSVRVAVIRRATRTLGAISQIYCEQCNLPAKRFQIDHVIPDRMNGEPFLSNAQLLCESCFNIKNPQDAHNIAKAKRKEASHLNAWPAPKQPIPQRAKTSKEKRDQIAVTGRPAIARRYQTVGTRICKGH